MQSATNGINGFRILQDDRACIFFDEPHGMPDPTQECPLGPDTRRRVRREAAPQSMCVFAVSGDIRRYIGPLFSQPLKHLEQAEKALNALWKAQEMLEATLTKCNRIYLTYDKTLLKRIDKNEAGKKINDLWNFINNPEYRAWLTKETHKNNPDFDPDAYVRDAPGMIEIYKAFIEQNAFDNIYEYCRAIKFRPRMKIQLEFLESVFHSKEGAVERLRKFVDVSDYKYLEPTERLEELPIDTFSIALQDSIHTYMIQAYELEVARWKPDTPFLEFSKLLRTYGPHACNGVIGRSYYIAEPTLQAEKWGDRSVYAWKKGATKSQHSTTWHCVKAVGAIEDPKASGGGYVYWLDPFNPSDPAHPELDKIYKVSYETFRLSLRDKSHILNDTVYRGAYMWHRKLLP